MSYIDNKVSSIIDDLGGEILMTLEGPNGLDDYIASVRNALSGYRQHLADAIRESFKNGLAAGRKRTYRKSTPVNRIVSRKAAQPTR
jgi:hypothetical protein